MSEPTPPAVEHSWVSRVTKWAADAEAKLENIQGFARIFGFELPVLVPGFLATIAGFRSKVLDPWGPWYVFSWWVATGSILLIVLILFFSLCHFIYVKSRKTAVPNVSKEDIQRDASYEATSRNASNSSQGTAQPSTPGGNSSPSQATLTAISQTHPLNGKVLVSLGVFLFFVLLGVYYLTYRERIEVLIDLCQDIDTIIVVYDPADDTINSAVGEMHRELKGQLDEQQIRLKLRGITEKPPATSSNTPLEMLRVNQDFSGALWVRRKTEGKPVTDQPPNLVVEKTPIGNWPIRGANVEVPLDMDVAGRLDVEILDYLTIRACEVEDYGTANGLMKVKNGRYVRPSDDISDRPAYALCWIETSYALEQSLPPQGILDIVEKFVPLYSQQNSISVSRPLFSLAYTQMLLNEGDLERAKDLAGKLVLAFRDSGVYEREADAQILLGEIAIIDALKQTDASLKKQQLTQAIGRFGRAVELGSRPEQSQATAESAPAVVLDSRPEQAKFAALFGLGRASLLKAQVLKAQGSPKLAEDDLQNAAQNLERALNTDAGACQKKSTDQWLVSIYSQLGQEEAADKHRKAARQASCPNPYLITVLPTSIINGLLTIQIDVIDVKEPDVAYFQIDLRKDDYSSPIYSSVIRVVADQREFQVPIDMSALPSDHLVFSYADGAHPELSVEASYILRVVSLDPQLNFALDQPVSIKGDVKLGLQMKPQAVDAPVKPGDAISVTAWVQGSLASNSDAIELEDPSILDRIDFWIQAVSTPSRPKKLMPYDQESRHRQDTHVVSDQTSGKLVLNAGISPKEAPGVRAGYLVPTVQVVYQVQTVIPTPSPTPAPTATPTPDERPVQVLVVSGSPVLYAAPALSSASVMTVSMECPVLCVSASSQPEEERPPWYQVEYLTGEAEILGWVPGGAVGTDLELPRFLLEKLAVVLSTRAMVYDAPNPEASIGIFLEQCTLLEILDTREQWHRIRVLSTGKSGPRAGWVKAADVIRRPVRLP